MQRVSLRSIAKACAHTVPQGAVVVGGEHRPDAGVAHPPLGILLALAQHKQLLFEFFADPRRPVMLGINREVWQEN